MYLLYVKNEPWWPRMAKTKMDDSGGFLRCFSSVMFHGEEWNIDWNTMLLKNCELKWCISHISHTSHIWYTYIYIYTHIIIYIYSVAIHRGFSGFPNRLHKIRGLGHPRSWSQWSFYSAPLDGRRVLRFRGTPMASWRNPPWRYP